MQASGSAREEELQAQVDELSAARAALSAALDEKMAELLEAAAGGRSAQEQLDALQASHSTQPRQGGKGGWICVVLLLLLQSWLCGIGPT